MKEGPSRWLITAASLRWSDQLVSPRTSRLSKRESLIFSSSLLVKVWSRTGQVLAFSIANRSSYTTHHTKIDATVLLLSKIPLPAHDRSPTVVFPVPRSRASDSARLIFAWRILSPKHG